MCEALYDKVVMAREVLAVYKTMLNAGHISGREYEIISTIVAGKFGLSSCSIFLDISCN